MSLFQCRRFQFFDLEKVDVDITVKENLKGNEVICGSSGRGIITIGDSEGLLHCISRQLESRKVAEAHAGGIIQIQQLKLFPYVVTLGQDEVGGAFHLKMWDILYLDMDSNKIQFFLKRTLKLNHTKPPTCFVAHENLNLLAVGYSDGNLQLYRGEFRREKNMKHRTLMMPDENNGPITGLALRLINNSMVLFVSAKFAIYTFDVTQKDRESKLQTDKAGNELNCSCYADGSTEENYIVGRNDAVYCYTHDARGPCYGFDGDKQFLHYFRGHLLIISKVSPEASYNIIVFDTENKYVGFSSSVITHLPVRVAVGEWGCFFLVTSDGTLWQLKEKDLQTKMGVFYKKNHHDLAIKLAKSNNFDGDAMADVFRKYGDHLYTKGDLDGAIRQYCRTVGKLEASYVVRKYIDASRVLNLLEYLEVVHKMGHATPDLTSLLLNCLTKLKLNEKIEKYVGDPSCDFLEPETAIKVFRRGGMSKHAYQLAQKHELYGSALQILLEDVREPSKEDLYNTLEKAVQCDNAEVILKRYGHALLTTLAQLDTKSLDGSKKIVRLLCESPSKRDLVDLFVADKYILIPLLENICLDFEPHDGPLMNLLLETYLGHWTCEEYPTHDKLLALLAKAPECPTWDWARALFACKKFGFSEGEIIAYEKLGFHSDLISIRFNAAIASPSLWPSFMETCTKYAKSKPLLWKDAFYLITTPGLKDVPQSIVQEILEKLLEENLMEPLPILDKLCQTNIKLGSVRTFLTRVLDRTEIESDEVEVKRLQEEIQSIRQNTESIRLKPSVFQGSRCNACMQKLEFPSVHFLCLHSFHQHCFESYSENDKDCPICLIKKTDLLNMEIKNKPSRAVLDADFALKMSTAKSNSFSVVADFFAKGIFSSDSDKISELQRRKSVEKVKGPTSILSTMENVTEARLRLNEGTKQDRKPASDKDNFRPTPIESLLDAMKESTKSVPVVPLGSGTRHFGGSSGGGSSISSAIPPIQIGVPGTYHKKISSSGNAKNSVKPTQPPKAVVPSNPFEDDETNPFLKENSAEPKNPFEDEDDYDPSLNPFES